MKARLLWLVILLALGGLVGLLIVRDPGYVLIAYSPWAVETSLWVGLALLVVAYFAIRVLFGVLVMLARGPGALTRWRTSRRAETADRDSWQGLRALAEGRWADARKQLVRAAPRASDPVVNLLAAARAAQQAGDRRGRDALLREARQAGPAGQAAVDFTQAELDYTAGDWVEARRTLERLRSSHPEHERVLWMLAECCRQQADWHALAELLPMLKRVSGPKVEAVAALEHVTALGRLGGGSEPPDRVWASLSKALRHDPAVVAAYGEALAHRDADAAEEVLRETLRQVWDPGLVRLYGRIIASDPVRQLGHAESWRKAHAEDPALFLTLGRLCLRNRRWPDARAHFETSLSLAPDPVVQAELGRLYAALGESRAADLLIAALPELPPLPLPARLPTS